MRVVNDAFRIVSRSDSDPDEESRNPSDEERYRNGEDSAGLGVLLNDIDGLKHEIQDRIRRQEAVRQARAVLMDDAARTDGLNRRLAALGLGSVTPPGAFPRPESEASYSELIFQRTTTPPATTEQRMMPSGSLASGAAGASFTTPWQGQEQRENLLEQFSQTEEASRLQYAESNAIQVGNSWSNENRGATLEGKSQRQELSQELWSQWESTAQEARRLLEESTARMEQAAEREERATASLQAVQAALAAARESAEARIEETERSLKLVNDGAKALQLRYEQLSKELADARTAQEAASEELVAARQDLTTSYQFAAVAAQRRVEARDFFERASRWAIRATAFSWCIMAWFAWIAFRQLVPVWAPAVVTGLILLVALRIRAKTMEEA